MSGAGATIEQQVLLRVQRDGLLVPGEPLVVLVSGGRDSTCLLDVAARVLGAEHVRALHVNYSLRGSAQDDERHCAELCERLGVQLTVERPVRPRPEAGNLQAWARDARYSAAARVASASTAVAAGHTATDQVETILYRLASSPSRRALLGMRPREGTLVRPLLAFTREQTAAYCVARGLAWREDETNEEETFVRARVRHGLVPAMRAIHPGAERNVLALAEVLGDEAAVLQVLLDEVLHGREEIPLASLNELPPALRRLVVQRLADAAARGRVPGAARRAQDVAGLSAHGTAYLNLGSGVRAIAEYGVLRFARDRREIAPPPEPVGLPVPGTVQFGGLTVRCALAPPRKAPGMLDRAALAPELLVRGWRAGDRMSPLGLGGSKSLQDLFTARRVPRARRPSIVVVESAGEIAWVAGVATSERFKLVSDTLQAVHLSVHAPPERD